MASILENLHGPEDVKALSAAECRKLAEELRAFLVEKVAENGGHLSSNLGDVELTLALHRVFDAPKDKLIFDVGHQAYTHKILTGRRDSFDLLRREGGLSGFPRRCESEYDLFDAGHASDSLSLGYGMAVARDQAGDDYHVVCIIGDGSLSGGLAFEALNLIGKSRHKVIIVLNDNDMAIGKTVGSVSTHLSLLRTRRSYLTQKSKIKSFLTGTRGLRPLYDFINNTKDRIKYFVMKSGIMFEEMGLTYLGPVDGHDPEDMEAVFRQARDTSKSVLIHVRTVKGKGYQPAEENPELFHGVGPFDRLSGRVPEGQSTYSRLLGDKVTELAETDERVQVITAAMAYGCGLSRFAERFPERLHDVGIAEAHGAAFAAGLARAGMRPFVAVYSTFLQRAYDQVMEDVCLNRLPVVFAIDRAGISGEDGETHQGIYDLAYLGHIPGLTLMAPASAEEMSDMLDYAYALAAPCGVRYPKGAVWHEEGERPPLVCGKGRILKKGSDIALLGLGSCVAPALEASRLLEDAGLSVTVADARFASPVDEELILELAGTHSLLVTIEEHVRTGGFGSRAATVLAGHAEADRLRVLALPDGFIAQGRRADLLQRFGLDARGIADFCLKEKENA